MKKNNEILKVKNLNVEFPIFGGILQREVSHVHAVKDLSLSVCQGETIGIVGESGSGKSTLGKAILNVLKITAPDVRVTGEILLNDNGTYIDLLKLNRKEIIPYRPQIQMIFQDPFSSLNPRMIVQDIIKEPMDIHTSMTDSEKHDKVRWLMEKVGLSGEQSMRYPHEFSGGQRQRIGIARSLATEPKIIIADEPVSALDVSIQADILNLLKSLRKELNLTYLFISHDLSVVAHVCDVVAVMYLGHIVEIAPSKELFKNPKHSYTKALLSSIPSIDPEKQSKAIELTGEIPSAMNPPSGCVFRTRCPNPTHDCKEGNIQMGLIEVTPNHWVDQCCVNCK